MKRYYGRQDPWKSVVAEDRSGQPDTLSSTDYSKLDYDRAWSSQEWKSEVTAHDRSGQPDKTPWSMVQQVRPHHGETLLDGTAQSERYGGRLHDGSGQPDSANSQEVADSEIFVMGSDAAEFVNKVNDQVRKRQKRISNVAGSGEEHSIIWGMFMAATMNAATFMGKNRAKVYVFSYSVLCLGRVHQHPKSDEAWKDRIGWIATDESYRDYDGINGESTEFEWNIFPGFTTLQLCGKVTDLLSRLGETPETFTGRILFVSMFNDISCDNKGNEEECFGKC